MRLFGALREGVRFKGRHRRAVRWLPTCPVGTHPGERHTFFKAINEFRFRLRYWCTGCSNTHVTPFRIEIESGVAISDQIVYAAKRAIVGGQMRPGDAFPSVRALSKELRINPNTAHKAITELINAGLLAMHPGIGTVVATPPAATPRERTALLGRHIEELVVEARRLGILQQELLRAILTQYEVLTPSTGARR
jgi:GntR family transcriptional regulator